MPLASLFIGRPQSGRQISHQSWFSDWIPDWPAGTACQVASAVMPSGDNDLPTTAMRSGGFGMRGLDIH